MMDLDPISVDLVCPRCNFYNPATIKQIRLNDVIICRGCKANIQLVDQMGEVGKAQRQIQESFAKLFAKPINLTLNF